MIVPESADCAIVGLQNGFKIEGQSVPQREFAACGRSEDTTGFGCPLYHS